MTLHNNTDQALEFGRELFFLEVNSQVANFRGAVVRHGVPDAYNRFAYFRSSAEGNRLDAVCRACGLSQYEERFEDDYAHYGGTSEAEALNHHVVEMRFSENVDDVIPDSLDPHETWPFRFHWNQGNWLADADGKELLIVLPEIRIRVADGTRAFRWIVEFGRKAGRPWSVRQQTVVTLERGELERLLQSETGNLALRTLAAHWLLEVDRQGAAKAMVATAAALRQGELLFSLLEMLAQQGIAGLEAHAINLLHDKATPAGIRRKAVQYLGAVTHTLALPVLSDAAHAEDETIAKAAVKAVARLDGAPATEALLTLLRDATCGAVHADAASALADRRDPRTIGPLREMAESGNQFAQSALADAGLPETFDFLREKLAHHAESWPRKSLIRGVARSGGKRAVPLLLPLLEDEPAPSSYSPFDTTHLVDALAELNDPSAIPYLVELAEAGNLRAVQVLAGYTDPSAREPLLALAGATKKDVRTIAVRGIAKHWPAAGGAALKSALASSEEKLLTAAIEGIGSTNDRSLAPSLLPLLKNSHDDVRIAAAKVLARWNQPETVAAMLDGLKGTYHEEDMFRVWNDRSFLAGPLVKAAQNHASAGVRKVAVSLLGQWRAHDSRDALMASLHDADAGVRAAGIEAMARIRERSAIPRIVELLGDPGPPCRTAALHALGFYQDPATFEAVARCAGDAKDDVRSAAAKALGAFKDARAVEPLLIIARRRGFFLSQRATLAVLARSDDPRAIPVFIDKLDQLLLKDEAKEWIRDFPDQATTVRWLSESLQKSQILKIRHECAELLAEINTEEACAALRAALNDPDLSIRKEAVGLLAKLADPKDLPAIAALLREDDASLRATAISALGRFGGPAASAAILTVLQDSAENVRWVAIQALAAVKSFDDPQPFLSALKDEKESVRKAVVEALGSPKYIARAVAPLIHVLQNDSDAVRKAAASALGRSADPRAVAALIEALDGPAKDEARKSLEPPAAPVLVAQELAKSAKAHARAAVRAQCVQLLGKLKGPEPQVAVIAALDDPDREVRLAAIAAASGTGDRRAAGPITALLRAEDAGIRAEAIKALQRLRDPATIAALQAVAADPEERVRCAAAEALGSFDRIDDLAPLAALLRNKGESSKKAAIALGKLADKRAIPALLDALTGPAAQEARKSLRKLPDREAVISALVDAMQNSPEPALRQTCACMLGELKAADKRAIPALLDALNGPAAQEARKSLQKIGDRAAVIGALADALQQRQEPALRRAGALVLGEMKAIEACDALGAAMQDPDATVRRAAAEALGEFRIVRAASRVLPGFRDDDRDVRIAAIRALQKFGDPRGIKAIQPRLEDKEDEVRAAAAEALAAFDDFKDPQPLLALLSGTESSSQRTAARTIARLADPAGLRALIDVLDKMQSAVRESFRECRDKATLTQELAQAVQGHSNARVRKACVLLLGELAGEADAGTLLPALRDTDAEVRREAIQALVRRNHKAAAPQLAKLLQDPDREVRKQALQALGKFADPTTLPALQACLKAEDADVRTAAVEAIRSLQGDAPIASFLACLADKEDRVREKALEALSARASFRDPLPVIVALRKGGSSSRNKAASLLGRIGDPRGIGPLIETLPETGYDGQSALKAFDDQELVVAELAKWLQSDASPAVRAACADRLADLQAKEVLPVIQQATKDPEKRVAEAAQKAIDKICGH